MYFFPTVSELNETKVAAAVNRISVDINGACNSIITCLQVGNCTAHCGAAEDIANLNKSGSASGDGDSDITVRLPPVLGEEYHCIVSGSNGSMIIFRARTKATKSGEIICGFSFLLSAIPTYCV